MTLYFSPKPVFSIIFKLMEEDTFSKSQGCPLKQGFIVYNIYALSPTIHRYRHIPRAATGWWQDSSWDNKKSHVLTESLKKTLL